jgi:uncharacterized SAM-binding protein YcdF (DUF218 family)
MDNFSSSVEAITNLLFIETPVMKSDLIFVFGNDWILAMDEVKKLYEQKISEKILITGHSANKDRLESEASRFMRRGLELGIPEESFLIEELATDTKKNFEYSAPIIDANIGFDKIRTILFVCKTFHTRRVLMTAKASFPNHIEYLFYPVSDERNIQKDNWWLDEVSLKRVLAEVRRIGEYSLTGDLSIK